MSAGGQQIPLVRLGVLDHEGRLALLIGSVGNHPARKAGDFVDFFVEGDAFLQVLELHRAADFREDRVRVRIPFCQQLTERDFFAILHAQFSSVNHLIAFLLTAAIVNDGDGTRAVH